MHKETLAQRERRVLSALLVALVLLGLLGRSAPLVLREALVLLALLVQWDRQALPARWAFRVILARRAIRGLSVLQGRMGVPDPPDLRARLAKWGLRVLLVLLAPLVLRAQQVQPGRLEPWAQPVPQARKAPRGRQVQPAVRARQASSTTHQREPHARQ